MREPERPDLGAFRPGFARAVSDWIVCRGSARAGLSRPRVAGASPRAARSRVLPCVTDFCPFWRRRGGAASSRAALVEPVPLGSDALSVLTLRQGRTCRVVVGVGGAGSHQWQLPARSNTTSSKAVETSCWSRRRLGVAPFPLPSLNCARLAPFQSSGWRFRMAPRPPGRCPCACLFVGFSSSGGLLAAA